MYVNTKKMAVSEDLMALAVVFIVLSGILDFNTLFFLAAACRCYYANWLRLRSSLFYRLSGIGYFVSTTEIILHYLYDQDIVWELNFYGIILESAP